MTGGMCYAHVMNEGTNFNIRGAIKTSREIKKEARERNTFVRGNRGKNVEEVQANVTSILNDLILENKGWVEEQKGKILKIVEGLDEQEVFNAFENGLMTFFKQQYRLFTQDQKDLRHIEIPAALQDKEYVRNQIAAYSFDFIQLLRNSIKEGATPKQALQLAMLAYHHNPDIHRAFAEKYPDVNEIVINQAVLKYPSHPEKFVENYLEKVNELSEEYPDVDKWVINFVALHYISQPEGAIDRFLALVPQLRAKYPDVRVTAIKQASLQPDPDAFIKSFQDSGK